jgi:hypothetical protein
MWTNLSSLGRWLTEHYNQATLGIAARLNSSALVESSSRVISRAYAGLVVLSIAVILLEGVSAVVAKPPNRKPTPVVIQSGNLNIPPTEVGVPLSFQIVVTGGKPPYTCLPDPNNNLAQFGLVLEKTCVLHGTPTKAGTVTF